jgi:hypothetical protein
MTTAPHHDFRRLWMEAATPGDTMRALCCLERAWSTLTDSIGDLSLLNSEELFEPLIELDQFQLSINEVLQRVAANQSFSGENEQLRPRPSVFHSPFETDRGEPSALSPSERPTPRRRSLVSTAREELSSNQTGKQSAVAVGRTKEPDFVPKRDPEIASSEETFPPRVNDRVPPLTRNTVGASENSTVPRSAAAAQQPLHQDSALDRLQSRETISRRAASPDINALTLPGEVQRPAAVDRSVKKSPLGPAPREEERTREAFATVASSLSDSADPTEQRDSTTRSRDVFERALGPTVERISEVNRRHRQQPEMSSIENAAAKDDVTFPDHRRRWSRARSSALQRLVARASADDIRNDEPDRSNVDDGFASFTRANCVGDQETDRFALQLSTLLRREMRHHGIDLAALEQ